MTQPLFTVFTPAYQRADTLHRVHDSLAAQTLRDFEWVVVDDGSTDETRELLRAWEAQGDVPLRWFSQPNAGKPTAWNHGVRESRGQLFLGMDSDDACVPQALERFAHHWHAIPEPERERFTGVTALCVDQHGALVGTRYPADVLDSDPLEIRFRHRVRGEKWGFHRTGVLRAYPFPTERGSYTTESVVWDRIARRYKTRYVNEELRIYYMAEAGDTITSQVADPRRHSAMFLEAFREQLNEDLRFARDSPAAFVRVAALQTRHALHQGQGPVAQLRAVRPAAWPLLLAGAPLGVTLFARDRLRSRG